MSAGFVTVYQTTDQIQAEMLTEVLVQEGLDARLLGTRNASLIGVGQHIVRLRIEVPQSQVAEAAAVVEAWETAPPLGEDADVGTEGEGEALPGAEPSAQQQRPQKLAGAGGEDAEEEGAGDDRAYKSPLLAAGVACIILGTAHIYARRPWTSVTLYVCLALGMLVLSQTGNQTALVALPMAYAGVILFDLIGGQFAVRAFNRGVRIGFWRQVALGAGAAVVVGGVVAVVAPLIPARWTRARIEEETSDHDRLRRRLDELEQDPRVHSFPFPAAPLAGESSAPSGR